MPRTVIWGLSRRFRRLSPCDGHVAHALRTLPPVAAIKYSIATPRAAPRLACVKPAASVHPEPGSNSSLYISISLSLSGLELTSCFACLYFTSLFNELSSFSSLSADLCVGLRLVCQSFTPVNSFPPHSSALTSTRNELQILFLPGTLVPSGDPLFVWGLQRYAFFVSLQTFFHLFFIFFQKKNTISLTISFFYKSGQEIRVPDKQKHEGGSKGYFLRYT